ncbi:N-acetylmuramoyl-L-alanine amidase [Clostridioides sp. GD02377]|uniref:N-acetylmuramoyl-L-alanine amidase n=1 Tax=unclassified Clostridioides TaxID=2635829 RepID=UPI0038A3E810
MKVAVVPGHTLSGKGTGAVGYIDEGKENRILTNLIIKWLKLGGATTYTGKIDKSDNYLSEQCQIANKQDIDLAVQIHFNANKTTLNPMGTETIYKTDNGKIYAEKVNSKLSTIFKNRGSKKDTRGLYWLNHTKAPAILIETCFVDSKEDTDYYIRSKHTIAKLIAEGILNKDIKEDISQEKSENIILYSGEVDKAIATIMSFYINNSTLIDVKDYKNEIATNIFSIGGKASKTMNKDVNKYIEFIGKDRKETFELVLKYLGRYI